MIEIGVVKSPVTPPRAAFRASRLVAPRAEPLPSTVRIREVGPRDGFQNEPEVIPTADKVRLIDCSPRPGLPRIEVTSFVRPDVIPQLADAAEVLAAVQRPADVSYSVLIPNERGLERALEQRDRFDEIELLPLRDGEPQQANKNRSIAESLDDLEGTVARAREEGLRCEGVISAGLRLSLRG